MPTKRRKKRPASTGHIARGNKRDLDPVVYKIRNERGLSIKIADACKIERAAVYQWKRVPPHWVQTVAPIIGLTPEQIRPDIFAAR